MKQMVRRSMMVVMALALALGAWGGMPAQRVAAEACSALGDYRTQATGNWNATGTWEYCDGTNWIAAGATPTSASGAITIRNGHTVAVTANVTVDQVTIESGGQMTVNSSITLSTNDGTGFEITVYGTFLHSGLVANPMNGTGMLASGGTYIHNTTGSAARMVDFFGLNKAVDSTWIFRGSSTLIPAISLAGKTFGNLVFESTSGVWATPNLTGTTAVSIKGNFTLGTGVTFNNNTLVGMILDGNWTNNGTFNAGTTSTVIFNGTAQQTIGGSSATTFNNLTVNSGATVVVPTTVAVNGAVINLGAMKQTRTVNAATVSFLNISTDKYYGADIATAESMYDVTVTVWGNQVCPEATLPTVLRCFDIAPDNGEAISDISFYYLLTEANLQTAPKVWHYDTDNSWWELLTTTTCASVPTGYGCVKATGIDSYSSFAISDGPPGPTAVTLSDFSAAWQGDAVRVTWETAQELDNLGFNLYRGESAAGPWVKLNDTLIPTQSPGAVFGAVYEWLDAGVTPGATPFYRLEDVDIYNVSTFHGPVSAAPAGPSAVTLTAFGARGPVFGLALALAATLGLWGLARKRRE